MHFGPEWMRPKTERNSRSSTREPSPPPNAGSSPAGTSSYSALVTPPPPPQASVEIVDAVNPFKYSRDEMFRIYKEGGTKAGLGLEVERWEGVVREVGSDPIGLKEMSEADKKVCSL
jgi:PERQ amino acid-rich with GYF domain-containing protein